MCVQKLRSACLSVYKNKLSKSSSCPLNSKIYSRLLHKARNIQSYMSHVMRKPVNAISKQQRHRSACLHSTKHTFAKFKISRLQLVSVAEQAGLGLTWSQTPKTGFFMAHIIYQLYIICMCIYLFFIFFTTCRSAYTGNYNFVARKYMLDNTRLLLFEIQFDYFYSK